MYPTHWCESLHPLVRIAPPAGANRSTRTPQKNRIHRCGPRHGHPSTLRQNPAVLSVGVRPGISAPDSGDPFRTVPRSPQWLIGLPNARKPSPTSAFSQPTPPTGSASRWPPSGRPSGCHCGRQDRGATAVGFGSVLVGGSGGRVFAVGSRWSESAEGRAGAGGSDLSQGRGLPHVRRPHAHHSRHRAACRHSRSRGR